MLAGANFNFYFAFMFMVINIFVNLLIFLLLFVGGDLLPLEVDVEDLFLLAVGLILSPVCNGSSFSTSSSSDVI